MIYKALKGVKDIFPPQSYLWLDLEKRFIELMSNYGYEPIKIPIIEETKLFTRSVGTDTDIVEKQMYTFEDKAKRSISLRPEATASVVRAYVEKGLYKTESLVKYFYMGPMFRNERPQAGRARQFHQFGVEVIGSLNPFVDSEVIALAKHILDIFGLSRGMCIKLNSLGCAEDKKKYEKVLQKELKPYESMLCDHCKSRLNKNVFRVLDCKNPECKRILHNLSKSADCLCGECKEHFDILKSQLDKVGVEYVLDPYLVRGLDYYTRTTFEISHKNLGAQDAIGAGGRYDNLVREFSGPSTGAVGFAFGAERILLALGEDIYKDYGLSTSIYIAHFDGATKEKAFEIAQKLRYENFSVSFDFDQRSLKKQFAQANKLGVKYVITIGEDELKAGEVAVKNMQTGEQTKVKERDLISNLK